MPIDYGERPRHEVRRPDYAVEEEAWIKALLRRAATCAIATVYGGQPFVNNNLFVYDEGAHAIYFHTARVGRTRANVENDGQACLSVMEMGRFLPDKEALEMSVEYASVVVFGRVSILEEEAAAKQALQLLLDKYFTHLKSGRDYRPITKEELARTAVYRFEIEDWSAKQLTAAADFPGAFLFGNPPPTGQL